MNTRRDITVALLGLPLAVRAVQPDVQTEAPTESLTEVKSKQSLARKRDIPPYSETAARIISYTIYAEARGESFAGKKAVASVIKTRSTRSKLSLAEVCLQNKQFTCWNDLKAVPDFYITGQGIKPADFNARNICFAIAWLLMLGNMKWDHYTHFYNPDKATPNWAFELKGTRTIGRHVFGYID